MTGPASAGAEPGHGREPLPVASPAQARRAVRDVVRPDRRAWLVAGSVLLVSAVVGLVAPAVLGRMVDLVIDERGVGAVVTAGVVLLVAAVVAGIATWRGRLLTARAAETAVARLREKVLDRAIRLPSGVLERSGTGDLVSRVTDDVARVTRAATVALPATVESLFTIAVTVAGLAALDWRLAAAGLVVLPIHVLALRWYLRRSGRIYAAERAAMGERAHQLIGAIRAADTVRAYRLSGRRADAVDDASMVAVDRAVHTVRVGNQFFGWVNVAEFVGLSTILGVGYLLVGSGQVTAGAATTAALFFFRLFDPVGAVMSLFDELQSATASVARLAGVLLIEDSAVPAAGVTDRPVARDTAVRLEGVGFDYSAGHPVLTGVDLTIEDGEHVAVVGASGAGKTTLAKLVAGILPPATGRILVGGAPVVSTTDAGPGRPASALVSQEVHVFAGTVLDDLRLAAPDATDDDLRSALAVVGARSWVDALPDGDRTVVGWHGHQLTAAQVQHLALARLVLADPLVAILDEATAEAGSAGSRTLEDAADKALAGRTAIVVAHRLSQAARADRVVVVDEGRILEVGTHDDLVAAGGMYARQWAAWTGRGES